MNRRSSLSTHVVSVLAASLLACACIVAATAQKTKPPQPPDVAAALQAMVRAEREFARAAQQSGTRAAFIANVADDGIVFGPGPVNGKKYWNERGETRGLLSWEPAYADMARSADIGYTTGPWEFRPQGADTKPAAHGQFMTIWRKQTDGTWKFALDIGTSNPAPVTTPAALQFAPDFRKNTAADPMDADVASLKRTLLSLERELAAASLSQGAARAFTRYADEEIRLMRDGAAPALGKRAALAALPVRPGALSWQTTAADAARSGEFAYTYGTYEATASDDGTRTAERGNYVRIWKRRAAGWRVVLDLLNPVPAPRS